MARDDTVLVVGGGISGLFGALLISRKYPGYNVVLVERGPDLGGLYSSFCVDGYGCFDHGPHIFYESGIQEVDEQIHDILPESDWICLSGNRKDIAGVYFNGRLQTYSHYPDIRMLAPDRYRQCLADFFQSLRTSRASEEHHESAEQYFRSRFGKTISELVVEPILAKIWGRSGQHLDPFVAKIVSMDRVILFDSEAMSDLMGSKSIRERLAYPDQLGLPPGYRTSTLRGFYPRKFGLFNVVTAIRRELESRGVKILTHAVLGKFELRHGRIASAAINVADQRIDLHGVHLVHWTAGLVPLGRQMEIQVPQPVPGPARQAIYANLVSKLPPRMGETYYFYCYDPGYRTFRVTNYASYCADAKGASGYPISVELQFEAGEKPDGNSAVSVAVSELLKFGVIESPEQITYAHAEFANVGMPVPTITGRKLAKTLRAAIEDRQLSNLTVGGPSPDQDLFFLHDILSHSYRTLQEWAGWRT